MQKIFQGKTKIIFNKRIAPDHFVIRLLAPLLAKVTKPGQFVQLHAADGINPFLRRPFSLLSTSGDFIDILYAVVGKGTVVLAKKKTGDWVDVLGPLGNCWNSLDGRRAILIGGGVGIPPLYFLAKEQARFRNRIEVFLGARHKSLLLCQKDFQRLGVGVHIATDDGSAGFKGYVTDFLRDWISRDEGRGTRDEKRYLYACGPEPMLKAVAHLAKKFHIDGEVSMEAPMACGFGVCVGCAIPVVGGGYKMCCYDGTVFKIDEVDWGRSLP